MPRVDRDYGSHALAEILAEDFPVASDEELRRLAHLARRAHERDAELSPYECCLFAWENSQ